MSLWTVLRRANEGRIAAEVQSDGFVSADEIDEAKWADSLFFGIYWLTEARGDHDVVFIAHLDPDELAPS